MAPSPKHLNTSDSSQKKLKNNAGPFLPTDRKSFDLIFQYLGHLGKDDVFFDLGCGDGRMVAEARKRFGCTAVGIDYDGDLIRDCRERYQCNGNVGDTETRETGIHFFRFDIFELFRDMSEAAGVSEVTEVTVAHNLKDKSKRSSSSKTNSKGPGNTTAKQIGELAAATEKLELENSSSLETAAKELQFTRSLLKKATCIFIYLLPEAHTILGGQFCRLFEKYRLHTVVAWWWPITGLIPKNRAKLKADGAKDSDGDVKIKNDHEPEKSKTIERASSTPAPASDTASSTTAESSNHDDDDSRSEEIAAANVNSAPVNVEKTKKSDTDSSGEATAVCELDSNCEVAVPSGPKGGSPYISADADYLRDRVYVYCVDDNFYDRDSC